MARNQHTEHRTLHERFDSKPARAGAVTTIALISGLALSACGPSGPEKPTSSETEVAQSLNDILVEAVASRPAEGTPEYEAFFAPIPYVEGQPREEVIKAVVDRTVVWYELGSEDIPSDVPQWMVDEEGSLNDLADAMQLDYYNNGEARALFGKNWKDNDYAIRVTDGMATSNREIITDLAAGVIQEGMTLNITNYNVKSSSATNIVAQPSWELTIPGYDTLVDATSLHLVAVDTNGDKTPDEWNWVGPAS